MAKRFTRAEWSRIRKTLNKNPAGYGLPSRQYGSLVIGSFNIRKLGKLARSAGDSGRDDATMEFLADVGRHFDLMAIQEVMPDLTGIRRLKELMGPEFGLIVSDIVGVFPGERGSEERLAFIYNRALVRRGELVTEVSTSRTRVFETIARHHRYFFDEMESNESAADLRAFYRDTLPEYDRSVAEGLTRKRPPSRPRLKIELDAFVQFIRTPFAVGFQVLGHPGLERYDFLAVNAHLHFGRLAERRLEAEALGEWILGKVRSKDAPNVVLLGDLNFDFDNPASDLDRVRKKFGRMGGFSSEKKVLVSFPFIFPHPRPAQFQKPGTVFRSNIGLSQTYDQIGIFSRDARIGNGLETTPKGHSKKETWGKPGGPDYGVFNFADLFSQALNKGKTLGEISGPERRAFLSRFAHGVSDHMPIWTRIPLPKAERAFPTKA